MAKLWITYAWADNEKQDIDFLAQELQREGLEVKLDRWTIGAGRRLWEQIEHFICSPAECDAWAIVATENSLVSEPCKEELNYALDRALKSRQQAFPIIALCLSHADHSLLPASLRVRWCVSVIDPDWKERIVAAAEGRPHVASRINVAPYHLHIHILPDLTAISMPSRLGPELACGGHS